MSGKQIIITVPQVGGAKVEAVGFDGVGCEAATAPFERVLSGGAVESRDYKPEWSNPESEGEEEKEQLSW